MTNEVKSLFDLIQKEEDKIEKTNSAFYVIVLLVVIGTFFDGIEQYNSGYAAPFISSVFHVSSLVITTQVTIVTFAFFAFGALMAGILGDYLGRRFLYTFNLLIYTLGALIGAFAVSFGMLLAGRAVVGIGLGGEIATGLTLLAELVPTRIRGQFTGLLNTGPGFGIFAVAALSDVFLVYSSSVFGGDATAWRWFLGIMVVPALLVFVYRRYIPETPRFLVSKGRVDEAFTTLHMLKQGKLYTRKKMLEAFPVKDIKESYNYDGFTAVREKPSWKDLFGKLFIRRTVLLFILSFITFGVQVSITVLEPVLFTSFLSYSAQAYTITTVLNVSSIIGTFLAAGLGGVRRKLSIPVFGLVVIAMLIVVVLMSDMNMGLYGVVLPLFVATAFIFAVNTTVWLYAPELYPTRTRNLGTSWVIIGTIAGVITIVLGVASVLPSYGIVGMAAFIAALYAVLVAVMLVMGLETANKPLEAISESIKAE